MSEVSRRYRVVQVHYLDRMGTVLLCLEPTDRLRMPTTFMAPSSASEDEKMIGRLAQQTVQALQGMIPPQYHEDAMLKIEITLEDYEKLGKPGILDEITLTLDVRRDKDE